MSPRTQLDTLKKEWESCMTVEDKKNSIVMKLFDGAKEHSELLSDAYLDLQDKKDLLRVKRDDIEKLNQEIRKLKLAQAHDQNKFGFVAVVIDGDCMPFQDDLVKQGMAGGKKAASLLRHSIKEEVVKLFPSGSHHLKIVVRVFANMRGLAKTWRDFLTEAVPLDDFVRGFNMGDAMCDYIDAGNGKECSDEKVKGNIQHYLDDSHCRQIFFGGSADNGYARLLGPYSEDESIRKRISLIRGPPFAYELMGIKDKFNNISFDTIFRTEKLPSGKLRVASPPVSPSTNYASAVAKASTAPAPTTVATLRNGTGSKKPQGVMWNSQGKRVDQDLRGTYSPDVYGDLKGRKLCNSFYLAKCPNGSACSYDHSKKLNKEQMAALRAVARSNPCIYGPWCDDPTCIFGHRCIWGKNCERGTSCRFSREPEMHHDDTTVVEID
ncbi:hypothetical protein AK830_g6009 [Neonectria ditissima]|uniref:C3H1-type domain-containing protein n=1 Tax=Neonectria ditissima TaxID=78410 RepID=A0A0P7BHV1_9HYPO|nr:hypothetical protein AK830_g6009 [Neonectria ditissima]